MVQWAVDPLSSGWRARRSSPIIVLPDVRFAQYKEEVKREGLAVTCELDLVLFVVLVKQTFVKRVFVPFHVD